ncbi:MAG TPA: hypothetical protein DCG12_02110 [Planctomycetaceae bacterium]|nr:hypothetical protein [Planctomycetaceae bacterium]
MPISWEDVQRLGLDQDTDAVIASTMATLTAHSLNSIDAARYLREQSLWYQSDPSAMAGAIEAAMPSLPASLQDLLGQLYAAIWGESATALRTDDPAWGPTFQEGVDGLIAASVMTQAQSDEFANLAGGKPWAGATEADAAAARAAHDAEVAVEQVQSDYNSALNTAGVNEAYANGDRAGLVTALRAAADILGA